MASITNRLYLIRIGGRAVAFVAAKDLYDAINKYITRIGFTDPYAYLCSYLMTNTITFDTGTNGTNEYCFITADTGTISGTFARISSRLVVNYDDIFSWIDINDPLFVRSTIEEVRNCAGFGRTPMYKLRKFCI